MSMIRINGLFPRLKEWAPVVIGVLVFLYIVYMWWEAQPIIDPDGLNELDQGELSDAQEKTVEIIVDLNKFLISSASLMFGAVGFYLKQYGSDLPKAGPGTAFMIALVLLIWAYYSALKAYTELTSELGQDLLNVYPGQSRILFYLEVEYLTAGGAAIVILSIFVFGYVTKGVSSH